MPDSEHDETAPLQPAPALPVRVTKVHVTPRVDLFFQATHRRLEIVVTVDELQGRPVFMFEAVAPGVVDQLAKLLELLQVPVAVFVDR